MFSHIQEKYNSIPVPVRAGFWGLLAGVFQKGINVIVVPIFTRILTTEEFAQYSIYQSWHDILIVFTSLCVYNYATYTAMVNYEDDKDGFIVSAQTLVTALTVLVFAIYFVVHLFVGDIWGFSLPMTALMFLDLLFFAVYNLWAAKERYEYRYKLLTMFSILLGAGGNVLGILLVHFVENKGYARIYGIAFFNIAIGLIFYVWHIVRSRNMFSKVYWGYIFKFCIPLIPHFLSGKILSRFDRIMISSMCGDSCTGVYSLAYSIAMIMIVLTDGILKVFTPWTYKRIKEGNVENIKTYAEGFLLLVVAANILLSLLAPEVVRVFAPVEYVEAVYIIPSVTGSVYFMFIFNLFANIEYYYSETKWLAVASIVAAVMNVILNYIFIPIFGYIVAGYTTLACYILYAIGHYVIMSSVSVKHANGYKYYNIKRIVFLSIWYVVITIGITLTYDYIILRYFVALAILICVMKNSRKMIGLFSELRKK